MAERNDAEYAAAFRERDDRLRAAIARGEVETVWSHALRHAGATLGSVFFAVWPAGVVGAAIGGALALLLYFVFGVRASFLILVGFIIAWGRSFWTYVSSSWFAELRVKNPI